MYMSHNQDTIKNDIMKSSKTIKESIESNTMLINFANQIYEQFEKDFYTDVVRNYRNVDRFVKEYNELKKKYLQVNRATDKISLNLKKIDGDYTHILDFINYFFDPKTLNDKYNIGRSLKSYAYTHDYDMLHYYEKSSGVHLVLPEMHFVLDSHSHGAHYKNKINYHDQKIIIYIGFDPFVNMLSRMDKKSFSNSVESTIKNYLTHELEHFYLALMLKGKDVGIYKKAPKKYKDYLNSPMHDYKLYRIQPSEIDAFFVGTISQLITEIKNKKLKLRFDKKTNMLNKSDFEKLVRRFKTIYFGTYSHVKTYPTDLINKILKRLYKEFIVLFQNPKKANEFEEKFKKLKRYNDTIMYIKEILYNAVNNSNIDDLKYQDSISEGRIRSVTKLILENILRTKKYYVKDKDREYLFNDFLDQIVKLAKDRIKEYDKRIKTSN